MEVAVACILWIPAIDEATIDPVSRISARFSCSAIDLLESSIHS